MKWILLPLACVVSLVTLAQSQTLTREEWSPKPVLHSIDSKLNDESAVVLFDKRRVEYIDEDKQLVVYKTLHKLVHIIDDKGIESFNRIYLPVNNNGDITDIKARTILPGGKIIELNKNDIKDLKEEDGNVYKIFALEGLEKGCEIEFYYTYKKNTSFFGREVFQTRFPVLDARMEVVSPNRLLFETKSFNSGAKAMDSSAGEKKCLIITEKNIPAAEDEKYCALDANLKCYEYKLAYNTSRSANERLLTWDELAKRVFENFSTVSDKETRKVNDLVNDMKVKDIAGDIDKIVAVENYVKKNFATRDDISGADADNLEKIIKTKLASHDGIVRLYAAIFRSLNVGYEFVLATNRDKCNIDKNFENWSNCENTVLYFPTLKKFMAPTLNEYRFPWINPNWCNTNACFCKTTTIGNFTTAFGEIRSIPIEDYSKTLVNTEAEIELDKTMDTLLVNISQIFSGYAASIYKAIFTFSSDENKRLVTKEMIKFGTQSESIVSSKIENESFESYHENKPFILSATVKASELVERAGNKIIVKVGDIIGPQVEMYQEKPRQFPMSIDFSHILERKINFKIPDGYTVKNADDLKISHDYKENGQTTMGFTSSYQQEGNMIKITIREEYRRTDYPLSQYEDFKKVINAAADFNKVVLILEKKQ